MPPEMIESAVEIASNSATNAFQLAQENGSNPSESIEASIDAVSTSMIEMGVSAEMIDKLGTAIRETYNEGIANGASAKDAFDIALNTVKETIEKDEETNLHVADEISSQPSESNEFNLDFAFSPNTPQMELLNEAIAKGMSVDEALKYLNNKMFADDTQQQHGPPTLAELQEADSHQKVNMAQQKPEDNQDSNQLNQMEADMDAESGNVVHENPAELDTDDKLGTDNITDDSKDDEIS